MLDTQMIKFKQQLGADSELRAHERLYCRSIILNGEQKQNLYSELGGVFARVYRNGVYGSASCTDMGETQISKTLLRAERAAKEADERNRFGRGPLPRAASGRVTLAQQPRALDPRAHIELSRLVNSELRKKYPRLKSVMTGIRSESIEKDLVVSNGYDAHTLVVRAYCDVALGIEDKNGKLVTLDDYYGKSMYIEDTFASLDWLYERVDVLYHDLLDYAEGVAPLAGVKDLILAPSLSGMLAHEAVGHTCEADHVLAGGVAGVNIGKQVASPIVTLTDYANTVLGNDTPLKILVDDEGTLAGDCVMIENGILKNLLHNRSTAQELGGRATGCVRAADYYDEPMIRMSNTAITPGTSTLEELISSIDDGYYLVRNENGQADTNGEFMIASSLGYEIKNGKLARPIRGTTVSGLAFDLLKTVSMISNELDWRFGGICGKKQLIENACGGPSIKVRGAIAGE